MRELIMKIKEVIVVEGRDDTAAVKRAIQADTIETNGSAIDYEIIEQIRHAAEKRGVIVLTDPDYPGEKIRSIIEKNIPGVKHAFIPQNQARDKRKRKIGVEHATPEVIREAILHAHADTFCESPLITHDDLIASGLLIGKNCAKRRARLGEILRLGKPNGKQLKNRLCMFQISRADFFAAVEQVHKEESY